MSGLQTLSHSAYMCKAEVEDKSTAMALLMSPARENVQRQALPHGASAVDTVLPHRGIGVESPAKYSQAIPVNNIDYTCSESRVLNADFRSDVKPMDADSFALADASKATVDNQISEVKSVHSRYENLAGNEVLPIDSSRRMRWLSGVSSSSASGGEESPRPGTSTKSYISNANTPLSEWFASGRLPQHHGQTSTPVNGWLDSASTPSQHGLKEDNEISRLDRSSGSVDGPGSINSTSSAPVDGISFNKSPNNLNTGVGFGGVPTMERLHPGINRVQDNRPWLSSNANAEIRWSSRVSVPEPFWASTPVPFHPQNEGVLSAATSARLGVSQAGIGADGSLTPLSLNGSLSDATNSMQMAQNISPSTPVAATPSKKRVCSLHFIIFIVVLCAAYECKCFVILR